MIEAMKVGGGNNYKMPHVSKPVLEKENKLPMQMKCDLNLVREVCRQLNENGTRLGCFLSGIESRDTQGS